MDDRLAEIKARLEGITPGQWHPTEITNPQDEHFPRSFITNSEHELICHDVKRTDAAFIAGAADDIRYLVSEVKRLRAVASGISGTEFIIAALQARDRK